VATSIGEGLADVPAVAAPALIKGAEPSYWFLRLRFDASVAACSKPAFCEALQAEGLPVATDYRAALPHTQEWFLERRVFGSSGYPWAHAGYAGDPDPVPQCPNVEEAIETHFHISIHEHWGSDEIEDAVIILHKVAEAIA
jgi:dTDP-4-amino-4,6-dideoxygalactose transaminase